jgi:hypothetical protein
MPNAKSLNKNAPKPTPGQAEGPRETVDEALERAAESSVKQGHRMDRAALPVAGANEGSAVNDARKGKKSQAA